MKKCYAMIHVWLHDMDHNIDLNYRRKIRPMKDLMKRNQSICITTKFNNDTLQNSPGMIYRSYEHRITDLYIWTKLKCKHSKALDNFGSNRWITYENELLNAKYNLCWLGIWSVGFERCQPTFSKAM